MPNWVKNKIYFEGEKEDIDEMKSIVLTKGEYENEPIVFNFNSLIPMPSSLNIDAGSTTDRAIDVFLQAVDPKTRDYGEKKMTKEAFDKLVQQLNNSVWFPRYGKDYVEIDDAEEWRKNFKLGKKAVVNCEKYNAITWYEWRNARWGTKWNSCDNYILDDCFCFNTAWSAPHPVIEKLAEMFPAIKFRHEWADEDIGSNCGYRGYSYGTIDYEHIPETDKEAIEFACVVWGDDPSDYGLVYDEEKCKYVQSEV